MSQIHKPKKGYKKIKLKPKYLELEIPDDWEITSLDKLITSHNSGVFKNAEFYGSGVNIVGVSDLYNHDKINGQIFRLVRLTDEEMKNHDLKEGDLIYGESSLVREGIGKTVVVTKQGEGTYFAWHTRRLKVNETVLPEFIFYSLDSTILRNSIVNRSTTTALTGITTKDYFATIFPYPPLLSEQQKIVSVLSNVDNIIQNVGKLIEKTIQLKKGLTQELLTRGIDHTKFKKVPWLFGKEIEIPEEWEVKKIEDVFEFLVSGTNARSDLNDSDEIRYIHYGDIHTKWNLQLDCDLEKIPRIIEEKVSNIPLLKDGDLIIADASEDVEGSGTSVLLKNVKNKKIVAGLHTLVLRRKDENISFEFMKYLTSISHVKIQIISYVTGSKVFGLSKKSCKEIKVPFPTLAEQQKIASVLSNVDEKIQSYVQYKKKLEHLKKSLMQKLLTGEVRVTI